MASKLIESVLTPTFMDLDTDIRNVSPNNSTYNMGMECFVIAGSLTKVIGNTIIPTNLPLPSGDNQVIGYGEDIANQRGVYMIWNSNGNHSIYCYTDGAAEALQVMVSPVLNFQLSNKIRKVECINSSNGTLCFWTDGYDNTSSTNFADTDFNSVRRINIDLALSGFYTTIDLQAISLINFPPTIEPTAVYATDANYGKNLFNNAQKLCQFAYCYEYYDDSVSVYSPLSVLAVPYGDETLANTGAPALSLLNNVINITFNTGSYLVTQITLGVRFGNTGNFGTFITLNKAKLGIPNDSVYTYAFYNDRNITIIDQSDYIRTYDGVPQVANTIKLIETDNGTNLNIAQPTEGFDNISVDITLQAVPTDISAITAPLSQPSVTETTIGSIYPLIFTFKYVIVMPSSLVAGSVFNYTNTPITQNGFTDNYIYTKLITPAESANPLLLVNEFYQWLLANNNPSVPYQPSYQISLNNYTITIIAPYVTNSNGTLINNDRTVSSSIYANIAKYSTFKSGAKHLVGIEYGRLSEGWEGTVQTANVSTVIQGSGGIVQGTEIYIPFVTQEITQHPTWTNQPQWSIFTSIYHKPPIWADCYRWVYAGNNTVSSFLQFNIVKANFDDANQTLLMLTPLPSYGWRGNNNQAGGVNPQSILAYNYTPGDRCRLIAQFNTVSGDLQLITSYVDVEVLSYDPATNKLYVQAFDSSILLSQSTLHNSTIVEIYTPADVNNNPIYYELSPTLLIGDPHTPNAYHKTSVNGVQDQDIATGQPCEDYLLNGDCWIKLRQMADANGDGGNGSGGGNIIEDYNFSDFYISNFYNKGRPNVIDPYAKRESLPINKHSQIFIPDTQINGLPSFWEGQGFTTPMNPQNGIITGLEQIGYEMHVYQHQKVTSILMERSQITNANNQGNNLGTSVNFYGSHNPRSDRYGTIYPESVCGTKTHRYFFDVINGCFVRVAQDRNWDISGLYGINRWTLALSSAMKASGVENFNVYGFYDIGYDKAYWTIVYNVPQYIYVQGGGGGGLNNEIGGGKSFVGNSSEAIPNPAYNPPSFVINGITYTTPITLVFAENGDKEAKGWQGFMPFHPEFYGRIGNQILSFKNGALYEHSFQSTPNFFYGGATVNPTDNAPCSVAVIDNKKGEDIKTWYEILLYSNSIMACPNSGDIFTLPNLSYPQGMSSRLIPSKFNVTEGVISANFMKDLNTPNTINPLLEGRDLKGDAISVMLSNSDNNPLTLNKVIISAFISDPTP